MKIMAFRADRCCLCFLGLCTIVSGAVAADWSDWRGPNQDGTVEAPGQFSGKGFGLEILWKKTIGAGYSGISVADGKVLTMFTDGAADLLGAFDARTGRELWRYRMGTMYQGHDGGHDGPVSTPVVDEDIVYALGTGGNLVAVGLQDGRERWAVSLVEKLQAEVPFWGFTTTPVVVDDVVVVQAGGGNGRALAAFDKRSGTVRWSHGDGRVDYRSPVCASLHGRRLLVVSTEDETRGVQPTTGKALWTLSFRSRGSVTPVVLGSDRVLLKGRSGAVAFRVPSGGREPTEIWQTREFRGNYAAPVPYQDHLYGFSGKFLTCVDARTGKRKWRSRPPGGKGVIIVDGHLVIFGANGDVVVAEANPEAYREKARLNVSDADGYTWPSFAAGVIYVRNLKDLVAVRTTVGAAVVESRPLPASRFGAFVGKLSQSDDKRALLDDFMKAQTSFPIVEGGRLVHFVYRGAVQDVAIRGIMLAQGEEDPLYRVEGTDLYYRSYAIEPGARWEYQFNVDFDNVVPDSLNSRRAPGGRAVSEVVTPGWTQPAYLKDYEGETAGRLESFQLDGAARRVQVYLPHGYDSGADRYPVVIVNEGWEWVDAGGLPNTLNHLAGEQIKSPIVVVVHGASRGGGRELGGAQTRAYARMLADELVPELDRRCRTQAKAGGRIIFGKRGAAVAAVYTALAHPGVFGQCVAISYGRADTVRAELIAELVGKASGRRPRFYVAWNRYEIWRPQSFDVREQSSTLAAGLKRQGFEVLGGERLDGAGWGSWRVAAGEALLALLGRP